VRIARASCERKPARGSRRVQYYPWRMSQHAEPGDVDGRLEFADATAGRLLHRGARFLLIRPETLIALQRALEAALGETAADVLVAGGRAGGGRSAATLAGDARQRVTALLEMGGRIGWGDFALESLAAHELVVTVTDSPFTEAHGPSDRPVCHLTRGVLHALAESVFEGPVSVRETACAATGAPCCRFEAAPK
jgi:uncharacterized protein